MSKIKRIIFLSLTLITSLAVISGCSTGDSGTDTTNSSSSTVESKANAEEIEVSFILEQDDEEIEQKTVTLEKETDLMSALQDNFDVVDEGGMITAINGIEQDTAENFYWTYTINDEMINTGAKDTLLNDGDKVVLTYAKF